MDNLINAGFEKEGYVQVINNELNEFDNENSGFSLLINFEGKKILFDFGIGREVKENLLKIGLTEEDIDFFVFHQASKLVIDNLKRLLKLSNEKVFENYQLVGNTVSSSIPIALSQAIDTEKIKKGSLVMLVGFGVGLSWGATIIRYNE